MKTRLVAVVAAAILSVALAASAPAQETIVTLFALKREVHAMGAPFDETPLPERLEAASRHLRRLFQEHVGATPDELARSRRAHFARRLLDVCGLLETFGLDGVAPRTLEEVGTNLGITRERVRQLEARALRELRAFAPGLELYLRS